ncbi:hypothetical protein LJB91_01450 [Bacteroidales bacterium OttesenSCG-928-L03]|nr:hypothetical protein [Bacteroidales bacterium OttesenSCG-928-L03]
MKTKIVYSLLFTLFLLSCEDKADIRVVNNLPNVTLNNIVFCKQSVAWEILPGQTKGITIYGDDDLSFPLAGPLEFIITSGDDQIFLKTREGYSLMEGETLTIRIGPDTEVYNPQSQTFKIKQLK